MADEQRFFRPIWDDFDGELFQDLVVDLLDADGYSVEPSGVGPDGGVDAFAGQSIQYGFNNPESFVWAVQCKFTSYEKSISPSNVGEILNVVADERFKDKEISGYLLATNGRLSTKMMTQLRGLNDRLPGFKTTYLDRSRIHSLLIRHKLVYKKYFWANVEKLAVAEDESVADDPIKLLEHLLDNDNTSEADLSAFFQSHPQLLTRPLGSKGIAYPEVRLGASYIADFILEPQPNEPWLIVELRNPRQKLFVKRGGRLTLSHAALQAAAQLREFARFFDDAQNREHFAAAHGKDIFRPQLILLIGRDYGDLSHNDIIELKTQFPGILVVTYADLLRRLRDN